MSEMIFCDAYGTYIDQSKCENCRIKKDCFKIKLPESHISEIKDLNIEYIKL